MCPHCNIPYCSVDCYRAHGTGCTEDFYRRHVCRSLPPDAALDGAGFWGELLARRSGDASPVESASDGGEVSCEGDDAAAHNDDHIPAAALSSISIERLQELSALPEITPEMLTEDEQKCFLRCVASGALSGKVDVWKPWWSLDAAEAIATSPGRVRELDKEHGSGDEWRLGGAGGEPRLRRLAEDVSSLPDFSSVSRRPASPCMRFLLVDVIYSYCRTMRLYNGDWQVDARRASATLLEGSPVLNEDARHASMLAVINSCCARVAEVEFGREQPASGLSFFDDVSEVLRSRELICCALLDAWNIMHKICPRSSHARKLWFHLLWAANCGWHTLSPLRGELNMERAALSTTHPHGDTPQVQVCVRAQGNS